MNSFTLLYDDTCPVCRASIDRLKKLDKLDVVRKVGLSEAEGALRAEPPVPDSQDLRREIHLITPNKTVIRGADAVAMVASMFPRSRWLGRLVMLPGIRIVARWIYGWIARHRSRISRVLGLPNPQGN